MDLSDLIERLGKGIEVVGVAVIVIGILGATLRFLPRLQGDPAHTDFRQFRQAIGRAILLGLEFLIAGDIIRTVAVDPTFRSVGVLAIIVAIRTFLSLELELEIEGRWPWQQRPSPEAGAPD
jgi:uncharacterized membrane protein